MAYSQEKRRLINKAIRLVIDYQRAMTIGGGRRDLSEDDVYVFLYTHGKIIPEIKSLQICLEKYDNVRHEFWNALNIMGDYDSRLSKILLDLQKKFKID